MEDEAKSADELIYLQPVTYRLMWVSQWWKCFMINQLPACSASPGASRGRCPSADDSSESPTQTSDSPKLCHS